jgi:hypothetical protein
MTALEKLEANERKEYEIATQGICPVCGRSLRAGIPQYAHKIAKTKANITRYGKEVINHRYNMVLVCSLECNSACNVGGKPKEAERLAAYIREMIKGAT